VTYLPGISQPKQEASGVQYVHHTALHYIQHSVKVNWHACNKCAQIQIRRNVAQLLPHQQALPPMSMSIIESITAKAERLILAAQCAQATYCEMISQNSKSTRVRYQDHMLQATVQH
jgi:hypothetical protein